MEIFIPDYLTDRRIECAGRYREAYAALVNTCSRPGNAEPGATRERAEAVERLRKAAEELERVEEAIRRYRITESERLARENRKKLELDRKRILAIAALDHARAHGDVEDHAAPGCSLSCGAVHHTTTHLVRRADGSSGIRCVGKGGKTWQR